MNKKLLSCFGGALAIAWIAAMGACIAPPESEESEDAIEIPDEAGELDPEAIVGEGAQCGSGSGNICMNYLSCCYDTFLGHSYCRNLQTDEENCGSCGHECGDNPPWPFRGYQCVSGTCTPY